MINESAVRNFLRSRYPAAERIDVRKLGSGVQGSGFLVTIQLPDSCREYVIKSLLAEGFGHDYPSDRAAVFLLDLDEYANLPDHVKAVDVLAEKADGSILPIGGGVEYYLMMEKVEGTDYFQDLRGLVRKAELDGEDRLRIRSLAACLARVHAVKKDSRTLYLRKLRDTVGHGECLMGVFDIYPDGTLPPGEMAEIVKLSVDWVYRLRSRHERLCRIHGDFHPGNVWFVGEKGTGPVDADGLPAFIMLDRSRGPWGEAADDVTALAINYIFFSVREHGDLRGACREGLDLFLDEYIAATGDRDIYQVMAPFFAFRSAVIANPVFYPDLGDEARSRIFRFARRVLALDAFDPAKVNDYLA